jgi:hypothetical protein
MTMNRSNSAQCADFAHCLVASQYAAEPQRVASKDLQVTQCGSFQRLSYLGRHGPDAIRRRWPVVVIF